jgi:hypothetical protein
MRRRTSLAKVKLKFRKPLIRKSFVNEQSNKMDFLTKKGYLFDALLPLIIVKMAFNFLLFDTT